MSRISLRTLLPAVAAATLLAGGSVAADDLKLSNKWRVEVSEGANTSGTILFRVTPKDGTPVDVTVAIKDGSSENDVAKDIRDAFAATLDKDTYHSERDDGEDVLLKKSKGPAFELRFVESSVKGTRINVEKE
jgi:hypothetical protein